MGDQSQNHDGQNPGTDPSQGTDWEAEAKKWEKRSKENWNALKAKTTEHETALEENAQLRSTNEELTTKNQDLETQNQDLTQAREAAEQEKAHADLLAEIAQANDVPANALRGATREELEAHAAELKELLPSAPVIPSQANTPDKLREDDVRQFTRNLFATTDD